MKYKKAMAMSTVIGLILVSIASIILIAYGMSFFTEMKKGTDIEACRISAIKATELKALGQSAVALDCPRINKTIKLKDVEQEGEINENLIKKIFAEEMRWCWYKMGKGANVPFNQNFIAGQNRACLVCSEIYFDDELRYELTSKNKEITGFTKYLNETRMNGEHYYDYFTRELYSTQRVIPFIFKRVASGSESGLELEGIDSISAEKPYYVIYEAFAPAVVRWAGSETKKEAMGGLFIIKSDDLPLLKCDVLYN